MRLLACVLLAVAASADPLLYTPYLHHAPLFYSAPHVSVVPTLGATPVAVGGYKAEAGSNGDLPGAVHEVPGLVGAPALKTQESAGGVKLTTGTGAYLLGHHLVHKREAEAEPAADADPYYYYSGLYGHGLYGYGYGGLLGYGYSGYYGYPYSHGYHAYYRGKREAEPAAEPEADPEADPYYLYSGYYGLGHGYYGHRLYSHGYGYGYGLGHYGYGYSYPYYGGYYGYYGK